MTCRQTSERFGLLLHKLLGLPHQMAFEAPTRHIAENSVVDGEVILYAEIAMRVLMHDAGNMSI